MIIRESLLPTQKSKSKCFLLMGLLILVYAIENSSIVSFIDSSIYNYIIKPILWIGMGLTVWILPKLRAKSKLKHRNFLSFWALNFAIIHIMASILAGMVDGLGRSPYSHSHFGILRNIIFVGTMIIGRELIRSYLVNGFTDKENYFIFIFIALLMTLTNISFSRYLDIKDYIGLVKFLSQYFAPEFAENLLLTYLVFLGGPLISIIYLGVIQGFHWLSPVLPDLQWITKALIGILCPIFFLMSIQGMYMDVSKRLKKREKSEESTLSWMVTSVLSIAIIWFAVGVFPVYPSVIATGSMEPMIEAGDIILVKKIVDMDGINSLERGEIIQFERDGILISHRITDIIDDQRGKAYRTKGDNNTGEDIESVLPEQIKGRIIYVIPKMGWPTLLIKNKDEIPLEEVVF